MTIDRIEILIQRCVDNECSPEERNELIQLLDNADGGWKNLACTYMEEQLFESACAEHCAAVSAPPKHCPAVVPLKSKHWFHHSAMSVALSACVVCLLTVIGIEEYHQRTQPDELAKSEPAITPPSSRAPETGVAVSQLPQTAWLEADGMNPRELPVYSDVAEFIPSLDAFRQQNRQSARDLGLPGTSPRIRYIKLKIGDEYVLFPLEEFSVEHQLQ